MESFDKDYYLKLAYKKLNNKIYNSKEYADYAYQITSDEKVSEKIKEAFTFENNQVSYDSIGKMFEDIDFVGELSEVLGLENKFSDVILSSVKDENIFSTIINTKFVETMYGNSNKEDLSANDALFTILESVFGLDTIIMSITNQNVLLERFNTVMQSDDQNMVNEFALLISNLYKMLDGEKDYSKIKHIISNNSEELRPFILAGLFKMNDDISKKEHSNFDAYNELYNRVLDVVGKADNKKM